MVAITVRCSEEDSPAKTLPMAKWIPRRHGASDDRVEHGGPSRSLWRQALMQWPTSPAILKKSARVAGLQREKGRAPSNQHELQSSGGLPTERNQRPQHVKDEDSKDDSLPDKVSADSEDNNLVDLSSSVQKLTLSSLHANPHLTLPTSSSPAPLSTVSLVKRASLYQELCEFCGNADSKITMFPDYFSDDEKRMVQDVAQELQLCCQVGEKNVAVYKLLGSGHLQHVRSQRLSSGGTNNSNSPDDVYVDVPELAQHGKEGFIARLRLRRLSSGGGVRRNMLWDVAQLSSTADGVADPVSEGEGGVYAVQSKSSGQKLALFKPSEEEKFVREGLVAGEGAVREEAAYVLDSRSNGFSGVPPTAVARLQLSSLGRAKQGAVQRFMSSSIGSMESFGMPFDLEKAKEFVPVDQVHRIALLDIRLFNTDRHPGNILLIGDKKPYTMVPIDHGCILPSWFLMSEARFDWLEYPQCRVPFSAAALQYITALDAEQDAKVLRGLGIREECVTTLKICTLLLQLAAARGKTLHWMGTFMVREGCFQDPSPLELAIQRACEQSGIPYTFKPNDYDEQRGEIEHGVLSRRPPNEFFQALQGLLLEAIGSGEGPSSE